ncbi:MAG: hypothetical protein HKM04_11980 [Legionellales bacterium]|nr:hypothetical protein [Legionellales bacterium]
MPLIYHLDESFVKNIEPFLSRLGLQDIDLVSEVIDPIILKEKSRLAARNDKREEVLDYHGFDTKLKTVVIQKLQEQENDLIGKIGLQLSSIDINNIELFIQKLNEQAASYPKEKLLAQAKLFKLLHQKQINYPFHMLWQVVIDGKNHKDGAYAFEDEAGYVVAALNTFTLALEQSHPISSGDIKKLHAHAVENVYRIDGNAFALHPETSTITANIFTKKIGSFSSFGSYSLEMIDEDDFQCAKNEKEIRRPASYLAPWIHKTVVNESLVDEYMVKVNYNYYNGYEVLLNNILTTHYQLIERAENGIEELLACIYLFREITIHHFFSDGNLRTSLLNFNSLLVKYGFNLIIFENPNRHDFHRPYKFARKVLNAMVNISDELKNKALIFLNEQFKGRENISWQEWQNQLIREKMLSEKIDNAIKKDDIYEFEKLQTLNDLDVKNYLQSFVLNNAISVLQKYENELQNIIQNNPKIWADLFTTAASYPRLEPVLDFFIKIDTDKKFIESDALSLAIERQNQGAIARLINYEFIGNTGKRLKNTFLHAACAYPNFEAIEAFFRKNPLAIIKENANGKTPIDVFFDYHRFENDLYLSFLTLILKNEDCVNELKKNRNSDKLLPFYVFILRTKNTELFKGMLEKGLLDGKSNIYQKIIFSLIIENKIEDFIFILNEKVKKMNSIIHGKTKTIMQTYFLNGNLRSKLSDMSNNIKHNYTHNIKDIIKDFENLPEEVHHCTKPLFISAFNEIMGNQRNNNKKSVVSSVTSILFSSRTRENSTRHNLNYNVGNNHSDQISSTYPEGSTHNFILR